MFTLLQTLSQASSTHLPEREVVLPGSSQAIPQLPDAQPMTYPPEVPCAEDHHDTAKLPESIPMVKGWLQTVTRRGDKNQASHRPDRLSREPTQPAYPRSHSNSRMKGNTAAAITLGPPRIGIIAAAERRLVSVLFFGKQRVHGVSDEPHQRTVAKNTEPEPKQRKPKNQVC